MTWVNPQYTADEVDAAGVILTDKNAPPADLNHALEITNNWRASHAFPLNTLQIGLRHKAKRVDSNRLVAQRTKRLSSIVAKLRRFKWLTLSEMQDIGGCRAIVKNVSQVKELVKLHTESSMKHKLLDMDDYIKNPKKSGYRGVHLIYSYYSDRKDTSNGQKIGLQRNHVEPNSLDRSIVSAS